MYRRESELIRNSSRLSSVRSVITSGQNSDTYLYTVPHCVICTGPDSLYGISICLTRSRKFSHPCHRRDPHHTALHSCFSPLLRLYSCTGQRHPRTDHCPGHCPLPRQGVAPRRLCLTASNVERLFLCKPECVKSLRGGLFQMTRRVRGEGLADCWPVDLEDFDELRAG